jgi:uncharacterized protein (UPF0332 family)
LKPETERYLDKARQSLNEARAVAGIELAEAAGRAAYLAMFHAAQALIFERSAKVPRTRIAGFTLNFRGLLRMNRVLASNCHVIYHKLTTSKPSPIMKLGPDAMLPLAAALTANRYGYKVHRPYYRVFPITRAALIVQSGREVGAAPARSYPAR